MARRLLKPVFFAVCFIAFSRLAAQQHDTLVFKNGDVMVGEIKSLDKGVVTVKTAYSDKDFQVEWSGVLKMTSDRNFLVTLSDGIRLNGRVQSLSDDSIGVVTYFLDTIYAHVADIVYIKGLQSRFWDRWDAAIDLGLNYTKANQLRQFSIRSTMDYQADQWNADAYFNENYSRQDSAADTRRTDAGIGCNYFLPNDYYYSVKLTFLSNTEQALKLRTSGRTGLGKFFKHTNKAYWGMGAGVSLNNEQFSNESKSRNSLEAFGASEINLFDIGDLTIFNTIYGYPSITEWGRFRLDFKLDFKYDLPKDFYIKLGGTLNYDNRPAVQGRETDYVTYLSFGWEL